MDSLGKLVLFRDVVRLGGFSHAARDRGLSHSTVSKHIQTLEEQLGVQLLRRSSRAMSLTEEGALVFEYSERVGAEVEELRGRLDERRGEVTGDLRVASLFHVGKHLVQPALTTLLQEHPSLRATLVLDDGPLAFHRDAFDVAVRVGLPGEGGLVSRKICANDVCLAASPELLERAGRLRHPSELARYPTVAYASDDVSIFRWRYFEKRSVKTVEVRPVCVVNDGNALLDVVRRGVGVGYLSAFSAREDFERGTIVPVLPRFKLPAYDPVYMLYASREYVPPKVQAFGAHLKRAAERLA